MFKALSYNFPATPSPSPPRAQMHSTFRLDDDEDDAVSTSGASVAATPRADRAGAGAGGAGGGSQQSTPSKPVGCRGVGGGDGGGKDIGRPQRYRQTPKISADAKGIGRY
jgi:hypothetical protein